MASMGDDQEENIEMWKIKKVRRRGPRGFLFLRWCFFFVFLFLSLSLVMVLFDDDDDDDVFLRQKPRDFDVVSFRSLSRPRRLLSLFFGGGPGETERRVRQNRGRRRSSDAIALSHASLHAPQLIKGLTEARGNGTSMISLVIPPKGQVNLVNKMLTDEIGTASNIKSRVNRLSVLNAIGSAQTRLKLYNRVPDNGLIIYTGTVLTDEGKEKKMNIDFEPFKPINTTLYMCDNKFHTECLHDLLAADQTYGFIIMDGNGTLYGTLCGNHREVLQKITVDLPKKHGRGGQSALRFARLRLEKRQNYLTKVAELATHHFITNDKCNVAGLILAGSADFKNKLMESDVFDARLSAKVLNVIDVSYGGDNGFSQAIELSAETLANVKFIAEKKLIGKFFDHIAQDTGKFCFGVNDTLNCLDMGAVETLVVWEDLPHERLELLNTVTGTTEVKILTPEQQKDPKHFHDAENNQLETTEKIAFSEWLATEYKKFGCQLEFISDKSQEGNQFCQGFGGIGGLLRYQVDLDAFDIPDDVDSDSGFGSDSSEAFI